MVSAPAVLVELTRKQMYLVQFGEKFTGTTLGTREVLLEDMQLYAVHTAYGSFYQIGTYKSTFVSTQIVPSFLVNFFLSPLYP